MPPQLIDQGHSGAPEHRAAAAAAKSIKSVSSPIRLPQPIHRTKPHLQATPISDMSSLQDEHHNNASSDPHAAERAMIQSVGLFRSGAFQKATVDSLMKERQEQRAEQARLQQELQQLEQQQTKSPLTKHQTMNSSGSTGALHPANSKTKSRPLSRQPSLNSSLAAATGTASTTASSGASQSKSRMQSASSASRLHRHDVTLSHSSTTATGKRTPGATSPSNSASAAAAVDSLYATLSPISTYVKPIQHFNSYPHDASKTHNRSVSQSNITATTDSQSTVSLLTAMTQRLANVEQNAAQQQQESQHLIASLHSTIARLRLEKDALSHLNSEPAQASDRAAQSASAVLAYQHENEALRRQCAEMESFLSDYGLVWIGYRALGQAEQAIANSNVLSPTAASAASASGVTSPHGRTHAADTDDEKHNSQNNSNNNLTSPTASASAQDKITFDLPVFLHCIADLNALAQSSFQDAHKHSLSNDSLAIVKQGGVVKFAPRSMLPQAPSLRLIVYSNGLFFKNGPLRRYSMTECQSFIRDVLDGFFPTELKDEFKDGVVFDCVDRHTTVWDEKRKCELNQSGSSVLSPTTNSQFKPFQGQGNRLDQQPMSPSSIMSPASPAGASQSNVASLHSFSDSSNSIASTQPQAAPSMSRADFLSRLPVSSISSSGQVVSVRNDIAAMLDGGTSSSNSNATRIHKRGGSNLVIARTPTIELLAANAAAAAQQHSAASRPQTPRNITTLHVKLPSLPLQSVAVSSSVNATTTAQQQQPASLLVKLRYDDTVATLRQYIDQHLRKIHVDNCASAAPAADATTHSAMLASLLSYEVRAAFPAQAFNDHAATLESARLIPNASLFIRYLPVAT